MSKPGSNQPFAKNNDFLKTFKHYKHYKDWYCIFFISSYFDQILNFYESFILIWEKHNAF